VHKDKKRMDTFSLYAVYTALEALSMAGINPEDTDFNHDRFGAIIGSGIGGLPVIQEQVDALRHVVLNVWHRFSCRFQSLIWRQVMWPCVLKQTV
jgi:3-oxoacyl-(acyl-carrier-protein) synthase